MRAVRSLVVVLAFAVFAVPSVVLADGRVALVDDNSTYAHIGPLPNPDNDAGDMAAALRRLGFEVTTDLNADRVEMTEGAHLHAAERGCRHLTRLLRGSRHRDGRRQLPRPSRFFGWSATSTRASKTVTVDDLLVSTSGACCAC